jgi:hypothetical protein
MNKNKTVIGVIILVLAIGVGYFLARNFTNKDKENPKPSGDYAFNGVIVDKTPNSIWVEGILNKKAVKLEFVLTPQTLIKTSVVTITAEQIKSEKNFKPQTVIKTVAATELKRDLKVAIKSNEDLSKLGSSTKATASEISFYTYDVPQLPN